MKRIIKRALAGALCVCLFLTSAFCFSVSAGAVDSDDFWDILGDVIFVADSDSEAETMENILSAVGKLVMVGGKTNPAYGFLTFGLADQLERNRWIQDNVIYDPNEGAFENFDEWAVFAFDKAAGIAYTLTTQYQLVKLYINAAGKVYDAIVVDDKSDLQFSPSLLAAATADYADRYGPKSTAEYISWRTDERLTSGSVYSYIPLSFRADGCFCGNDSWVTDVYLVPFYVTDGIYYYGTYQYHYYVYFDKDEDGNYILDDNGRRIGYIKCDYYNMTVEDSPVNTVVITDDYYGYPYMDIGAVNDNGRLTSRLYLSLTDYLKVSFKGNTISAKLISSIGLTEYVSDDFTVLVDVSETSGSGCRCSYVGGNPTNHDANCDKLCDIGYYCSNKPIKMELDIDWSKFAEDDVVTLSGDTIYDCVITNNNGDTSTINEYITNNYIYITNNNGGGEGGGSGSSSGGTVGGNVTVGGNIDVGGSVDVNVNVNGGSGDSMSVDVDLDNYLAQTPEQAQPITQFISIFFDFLPPELLGLICLGVAVAIILRIWGR